MEIKSVYINIYIIYMYKHIQYIYIYLLLKKTTEKAKQVMKQIYIKGKKLTLTKLILLVP